MASQATAKKEKNKDFLNIKNGETNNTVLSREYFSGIQTVSKFIVLQNAQTNIIYKHLNPHGCNSAIHRVALRIHTRHADDN